ncbi:MAG TPA: exodeoxyribonuclease VII large subunit [Candidatus Tumulicola sp.]
MIENGERDYPVRTVGEIVNYIAKWFNDRPWFNPIGVRGEVSEVKVSRDGALRFDLKENRAIISCVAWSSVRLKLPDIKNGDSVIVVGKLGIYRDRGAFSLDVESIELTGLGELFLRYERLKKKFIDEGLFEDERKRAIALPIRRVALVTAKDGKGAQDFLKTLREEVPAVRVVLVETRVQGEGAEIDIADALDRAGSYDIDAIVLARGGGTYADLFPFNLEPVVRAILRARVPVITAIGHEPDRHLADEVADRVFGTPSKAAAFIAHAWLLAQDTLTRRIQNLESALREIVARHFQWIETRSFQGERAVLRIIESKRASFSEMDARLERLSPRQVLVDNSARTFRLSARLDSAIRGQLSASVRRLADSESALNRAGDRRSNAAAMRLQNAFAALAVCDPLAPLTRGYAIVSAGGRAVRDASSLRPGDAIVARLERGTLAARVEAVNDDG